MKDGWYFACPMCLKIGKEGWTEVYKEVCEAVVLLKEKGDEYDTAYDDIDTLDTMHIETRHECGFETKQWVAEDFVIKIENGKVVEIGDYWYNASLRELEGLLRKNNLKLDKERVLKVVG